MAPKQNIGDILMGFGKITQEDVERALGYQSENGGYFGEALIALGLVSPEEIEWSLASQFDLPYIFPEADSIDPEAVSLVTPEWALAHLTLPITRSGSSVTVVVDSPMRTEAVEDLAKRTGCEISLALASATDIRELIREVFSRVEEPGESDRRSPISLEEGLALTLGVVSGSFGISTRGTRSIFWYDDDGTIRRRLLLPDWSPQLDSLMDPRPSEQVSGHDRAVFSARLNRRGMVGSVDVRYLADESGQELLMRPAQTSLDEGLGFSPPPAGIVSEVALLSRSGAGRFLVTSEPEELGHRILPRIPDAFLESDWRSIYVHADATPEAQRAFSLRMPEDAERWPSEFEALCGFRFDVVTVDLDGPAEDWIARALRVASVAFILRPDDADRDLARRVGIRWELHISEGSDGHLEWSLDPLS